MDLQDANTESFFQFFHYHENFDASMKLAYGALQAISLEEDSEASKKEGGLLALPTGGEPWGSTTRWRTITHRIPSVRRFLSQMGVVLVASAFEDFVTNVISEHDRYADFQGNEPTDKTSPTGDLEKGVSVRNLYLSRQWDLQRIEYLLPLYDYFMLARNCIVHRSGRASKALVEHTESKQFKNCIERWPSKPRKRIPELPHVREGHDIVFYPRHAILFGEVCRRAAKETNSLLVEFLGANGTVYMAAYYGLLSDDRVHVPARRSPEQIMNFILTERWNVKVSDRYEVIRILKHLDKWTQCRLKYEKLHPKAKLP
jgi:hypothetical protein